MKTLKYTLIVLFSVVLMSCGGGGGGEKVDEIAPTLTINSPTASQKLAAGANLNINFTAKDNVALASYNVTVAYDGVKSVKTVQEFSFNSLADKDADGNNLPTISGANQTINFDIKTPDNATPGSYKLTVTVKDGTSNSINKNVSFEIE